MSLLGTVLFDVLMAGLGLAMIGWALVDVRRGYNYSDSLHIVENRWTDCLQRDIQNCLSPG